MQIIRNNYLKDYSKKVPKNIIERTQKHKIKTTVNIFKMININNNKYCPGRKKIQLKLSKSKIKIVNFLRK